ncbi:ribulose-phosphate 3-epimerase [Atheta coriaria]|uniref:ribulose-phosphate 3-epimerase n=1 Tax=Dalotia coriaria TaxID=877792 RepID=UPI0031F38A36
MRRPCNNLPGAQRTAAFRPLPAHSCAPTACNKCLCPHTSLASLHTAASCQTGTPIRIAASTAMNDRLKCKIGPSILNADLSQLYKESQRLLDNGADYLHLDVMDGHFVPNLTFGAPVVKCLRSKIRHAFFETHMMVQNPEQWIEPMADAGVDQYTFHIEPVKEIIKTCRKVREAGMKVGLALKPGTEIDAVRQFIDQADMILIMTVEPGFGGQKFMTDMMPKVQWLRHNYPLLDVEVDGGVGLNTIAACADAGANMIVSGTAIINAPDQRAVIASLRETVESSIHKCSV